jgi:hypothetical protein
MMRGRRLQTSGEGSNAKSSVVPSRGQRAGTTNSNLKMQVSVKLGIGVDIQGL